MECPISQQVFCPGIQPVLQCWLLNVLFFLDFALQEVKANTSYAQFWKNKKKKKTHNKCSAGVCFPAVPSQNALSVQRNTSAAQEASRAENLLSFLLHHHHSTISVPEAQKPRSPSWLWTLVCAQDGTAFNCTALFFCRTLFCSLSSPFQQSSGITLQDQTLSAWIS